MSIAQQLYQLQETELEIAAAERAISQLAAQIEDDRMVTEVRGRLAQEKKHLEDLAKEQRSTEWEIDDLSAKLTTMNKDLYSGRIKNPKELSALQQEVEILKAKQGQLEDKDLGLMEQIEQSRGLTASIAAELAEAEVKWQAQKQELKNSLEAQKNTLSNLNRMREQIISIIPTEIRELYRDLKSSRGLAVAKVEQGVCRGCRIMLPTADMQQVKGGHLVQCKNCSRILYLA